MQFSEVERYDILSIYLENNKNAVLARREYARKFPDRRLPSRMAFPRIMRKLRDTRSLKNLKRQNPDREDRDLEILLQFQENPNWSISTAARNLGYSCGLIHKTLKKYNFRPYKFLPVQKLTAEQIEVRYTFSEMVVNRLNNEPYFFNKIIWTDEATFTTSGEFNRQNKRYWAMENPHCVEEIKTQGRRSLHVWCGILGNKVVGPVFYEGNMTGVIYHQFLLNEIEHFLQQNPEYDNNTIWQQDGAPPHNIAAVTNFLNNKYIEWIGRYGTIRWPANSPDLTPLDTFLWAYLKNEVYKNRTEEIGVLQERIRNKIEYLNNNNYIIRNSIRNLEKRYRLCFENNGRHFEQYL